MAQPIEVLKKTFDEFIKDDCPAMAAALAYYTVISMPPMLVLVVMIAGFVFGREAVHQAIVDQIRDFVGGGAGEQVGTMIGSARETLSGGTASIIFGIGVLIFAATTSVAHLQTVLNRAWEVQPDPKMSGITNFFTKRLLSFAMILGIAFLLLVSMALSTALAAFGNTISGYLAGFSSTILQALSFVVSLVVITFLFSAMFKFMPDAEIRWEDVWVGGFFTASLFVIGKFLIGFYFGKSDPGGMYGAAGSLILILIWIYYSSMILLVGAEFTQVYAKRYGKDIEPSFGAVRSIREDVTFESAEEKDQHKAATAEDKEEKPRKVKFWTAGRAAIGVGLLALLFGRKGE